MSQLCHPTATKQLHQWFPDTFEQRPIFSTKFSILNKTHDRCEGEPFSVLNKTHDRGGEFSMTHKTHDQGGRGRFSISNKISTLGVGQFFILNLMIRHSFPPFKLHFCSTAARDLGRTMPLVYDYLWKQSYNYIVYSSV